MDTSSESHASVRCLYRQEREPSLLENTAWLFLLAVLTVILLSFFLSPAAPTQRSGFLSDKFTDFVIVFSSVFVASQLALSNERKKQKKNRELELRELLRVLKEELKKAQGTCRLITHYLFLTELGPTFDSSIYALESYVERVFQLSNNSYLHDALDEARYELRHINRKLDMRIGRESIARRNPQTFAGDRVAQKMNTYPEGERYSELPLLREYVRCFEEAMTITSNENGQWRPGDYSAFEERYKIARLTTGFAMSEATTCNELTEAKIVSPPPALEGNGEIPQIADVEDKKYFKFMNGAAVSHCQKAIDAINQIEGGAPISRIE